MIGQSCQARLQQDENSKCRFSYLLDVNVYAHLYLHGRRTCLLPDFSKYFSKYRLFSFNTQATSYHIFDSVLVRPNDTFGSLSAMSCFLPNAKEVSYFDLGNIINNELPDFR